LDLDAAREERIAEAVGAEADLLVRHAPPGMAECNATAAPLPEVAVDEEVRRVEPLGNRGRRRHARGSFYCSRMPVGVTGFDVHDRSPTPRRSASSADLARAISGSLSPSDLRGRSRSSSCPGWRVR